MDTGSDVLSLLNDLAPRIELHRIHFAWARPLPPVPRRQNPAYRLTIPLKTPWKMTAAYDGEVQTRELAPGEAVFFRRFAWDLVRTANETRRNISLVFRPECIRIVSTVEDSRHSTAPLSPAGLHLVQALDCLAQEPEQDQALASCLAELLVRRAREDFDPLPGSEVGQPIHTWMAVKTYIAEHYQDPINRGDVARELELSPGYISTLFTRFDSQSFSESLRSLRLDHAEQMLRTTDDPLERIAEACGFANSRSLLKVFQKAFGMPPGRYRRQAADQA
jgi:AraC-like DNA-binding protein